MDCFTDVSEASIFFGLKAKILPFIDTVETVLWTGTRVALISSETGYELDARDSFPGGDRDFSLRHYAQTCSGGAHPPSRPMGPEFEADD